MNSVPGFPERELWKHSAFVGVPFNLEIMPTGNVRSDAIVKKVEIYDRLDNIVKTITGPFYREPKKGLFYYKDLVLDIDPGPYFDVWTFLDARGRKQTVKSGFILHNTEFAAWPAYKIRPYIKRIDIVAPDMLNVIIASADPFLWIKEAQFRAFNPEVEIEYDWFHETGENIFLFKMKENVLEHQGIEVILNVEGFDRQNHIINNFIRLKPQVIK